MLNKLIGFLALIVNCIQQLPQLYKTYHTKKVDDLSSYSLILILLTSILWFIHGYIIGDIPLLLSGLITIIINGGLLGLYLVYRIKEYFTEKKNTNQDEIEEIEY